MKNYLKCIWWNKWLLAAYSIIILTTFLIWAVSANYAALLVFPVLILIFCKGGFHTLSTYKRLVYLYKAGKQVYIAPELYCESCALRWFHHDYPDYNKKIQQCFK